jgi:hypothetical protein
LKNKNVLKICLSGFRRLWHHHPAWLTQRTTLETFAWNIHQYHLNRPFKTNSNYIYVDTEARDIYILYIKCGMTLQKNWQKFTQNIRKKLKFIYEQIYSFFWAKKCLLETLIQFETLKKWANLFTNLSKFTLNFEACMHGCV